jgi:DNA adenine methylase
MLKLRSLLRWPGGKARHLKTILPLITPHTCYVEPFAGGLAVLLAKEPSRLEVINDANRDLITLYRCAQHHPEALCEEISWLLAARVNVQDFRSEGGITDLQRAGRFLVRNRASFGGKMDSFAVSKKAGGASFSKANLQELIRLLNTRLDRAMIECVDWERCVKLYDAPETFFFFDPPYLHAPTGVYEGWDEAQMERLATVLETIQGRWLLTVDGSEFCQRLFAKWNCRLTLTKSGLANQRTHSDAMFSELFVSPLAG